MRTKVNIIDVVADKGLRRKELQATEAFRRFFPSAPPLRLYRTRDGRVGFQAQVALLPGQRDMFARAYAAVMRVLGETRGRARAETKVQAKLRLREPIYRALKSAAKKNHVTVSALVEDLAERAHLVGA